MTVDDLRAILAPLPGDAHVTLTIQRPNGATEPDGIPITEATFGEVTDVRAMSQTQVDIWSYTPAAPAT